MKLTRLPIGHHHCRAIVVILPLLAVSALLTGCGGGSKAAVSPGTTTPTTTVAGGAGSAATSATFAKYTQCLESHGVPASAAGSLFGGGGRRGPGAGTGTTVPGATTVPRTRPTIPAQYQAAFTACASDRPSFGGFGGGAGGGFNSTAFTDYRNCLVVHGVTLPTPPTTTPGETRPTGGFGAGGGGDAGGFGAGAGGVLNTPAGKAAQQACASLLPARTGTSTTTTVVG